MSSEQNGESFTTLLLQNQKRIYGLILSLVPNSSEADDIMQDACTVMWKKFEDFEPGTNFPAWALKIARFQVMTYFNKKRRAKAHLSDESIDLLVDEFTEMQIDKASRMEHLNECLKGLSDGNRELIFMRYKESLSVESIAEKIGKSIHALYKALNRSHAQLQRCIRQKGT